MKKRNRALLSLVLLLALLAGLWYLRSAQGGPGAGETGGRMDRSGSSGRGQPPPPPPARGRGPGPRKSTALLAAVDLESIPPFSGEPYVALADNVPSFLPGEMTTSSYEVYSPLDGLGRCGAASACVGLDIVDIDVEADARPLVLHAQSFHLYAAGNKCVAIVYGRHTVKHVVPGFLHPSFLPGEMTTSSYEVYSPLDGLGRCGAASACVGVDLMPTEERESIGQVKPSGHCRHRR